MKFFKKFIAYSFIMSMILNTQNVLAKDIKQITTTPTIANVIQVIDGDTIKVKLPNGDLAYVKLKGITSNGSDESFKYLTDTLLGEDITLLKNGVSYTGDTFNYLTVILNDINVNNEMLRNGLAIADKNQTTYNPSNELPIKNPNFSNVTSNTTIPPTTTPSSNNTSNSNNASSNNKVTGKVNINTATIYQLQNFLIDVPKDVIKNIVDYREKNPFSNIQEIKFVKGFTKNLYDKNKDILKVSTNLNTATEFELKTLYDISDSQIEKILKQRKIKNFEYVSDVRNIISSYTYDKISPYISVSSVNDIKYNIPNKKANISISPKVYLTNPSVSSTLAEDIFKNRVNGYTYKTLMELTKISKVSETELNYLEDNLEVFTNVNTKNIDDLLYVFSKPNAEKIVKTKISQLYEIRNIVGDKEYERIKNAICINTNKDEYVNINTASKEQMYSQGISVAQASEFIRKRPIKTPNELPFNISNLNNKISLYTDINTASRKELSSLSVDMSNAFLDKIIAYRKEQPFGSLDEVKEFFKTNNAFSIFEKIKNYIVIR